MGSQSDQFLIGFACPMEPIAPEILDAIVCEYARGYTRVFLDRFQTELRQISDGLVDLLEEWLESESTFDVLWSPRAGMIRTAVLSRTVEPAVAAAQFALHLNAYGYARSWSVKFGGPANIVLNGRTFPGTTEVDVCSTGDNFVARLRHGNNQQAIVNIHHPSGTRDATRLDKPGHCRMDKNVVELLIGGGEDYLRPEERDHGACPLPLADAQSACNDAISLLRASVPPYLEWVDRVIREIVPVDGSDGILRSSSSQEWPGIIEVSFPSQPAATAEMLVHEASHQYIHILTRSLPLHDPSDQQLYYSPVKGTGRPIAAILLAFHAFANVVLFYRACVEDGFDDGGYCQRNLERHYAELDIMRGHLQSANSLTETGVLLWETLADRVFSGN